jgi:hypothetical protein
MKGERAFRNVVIGGGEVGHSHYFALRKKIVEIVRRLGLDIAKDVSQNPGVVASAKRFRMVTFIG